ELPGRFRGAHLKVPHRSMLTLACVVHAHWCFHGNGGAAWVAATPEKEGSPRAAFHRASKPTEKHTNQISLLQNKTIMLVSQVYSHTYSRYFAHLKVPHRTMLTLACVVHAHMCLMVMVVQRLLLPHRKGRDSGEQHFREQ